MRLSAGYGERPSPLAVGYARRWGEGRYLVRQLVPAQDTVPLSPLLWAAPRASSNREAENDDADAPLD